MWCGALAVCSSEVTILRFCSQSEISKVDTFSNDLVILLVLVSMGTCETPVKDDENTSQSHCSAADGMCSPDEKGEFDWQMHGT